MTYSQRLVSRLLLASGSSTNVFFSSLPFPRTDSFEETFSMCSGLPLLAELSPLPRCFSPRAFAFRQEILVYPEVSFSALELIGTPAPIEFSEIFS